MRVRHRRRLAAGCLVVPRDGCAECLVSGPISRACAQNGHVHGLPAQIHSINFWGRTGGQTSERGRDSAGPHVRAIKDEEGRILVLMTHNTDFGDAFERESNDHRYFLQFAPAGCAFGVNVIIDSMTH
jgi:hypothetical protein